MNAKMNAQDILKNSDDEQKTKRIIILLATIIPLGVIFVYVWMNYSEGTFLLVVFGVIALGMALERIDKMLITKRQRKNDNTT